MANQPPQLRQKLYGRTQPLFFSYPQPTTRKTSSDHPYVTWNLELQDKCAKRPWFLLVNCFNFLYIWLAKAHHSPAEHCAAEELLARSMIQDWLLRTGQDGQQPYQLMVDHQYKSICHEFAGHLPMVPDADREQEIKKAKKKKSENVNNALHFQALRWADLPNMF